MTTFFATSDNLVTEQEPARKWADNSKYTCLYINESVSNLAIKLLKKSDNRGNSAAVSMYVHIILQCSCQNDNVPCVYALA